MAIHYTNLAPTKKEYTFLGPQRVALEDIHLHGFVNLHIKKAKGAHCYAINKTKYANEHLQVLPPEVVLSL